MIRYSKRPKDRFAAEPGPHGDPSRPEVEKVSVPAETRFFWFSFWVVLNRCHVTLSG